MSNKAPRAKRRVGIKTLFKMAKSITDREEILEAEKQKLSLEARKLNDQLDKVKREISDGHLKLNRLHELSIILSGVSEDVLSIRKEIFAQRALAQSEDISVKQAREARQQAQDLHRTLKAKCTHSLVIYTPKYEGSSSYDYDDQRPEQRRCLICGLNESGPSFKALTESEERLLRYVYHIEPYQNDLESRYFSESLFIEDEKALQEVFLTARLREVLEGE